MRLIDADVVFLLHAIEELLDELFKLLGAHRFDLLAQLLVQHVAVHQRFGDRVAKVFEGLFGGVLVVVVRILPLEPTLQQMVGEGREQILHAHLRCGLGNVLFVLNELHAISGS